MNWLFAKIAQFAIGNKLISALAWVHNALDGHRSEIVLAIMAGVYGLKYTGLVPADTAKAIWLSLSPLLSATLADKASKVKDQLDSVLPAPPSGSTAA